MVAFTAQKMGYVGPPSNGAWIKILKKCSQVSSLALCLRSAPSWHLQPYTMPDRIWTIDADGDGFGDSLEGADTLASCSQPTGQVTSYAGNNDDCNDRDSNIHNKDDNNLKMKI